MKKSELYHFINMLIQKNKNKKHTQKQDAKQFVQTYYMDYLKRNKLLPSNKRQKIKDIMKSFQYLDSYVDLSDIIMAIQDHVNNQNKEAQENQNRIKGRSQKKKTKFVTENNQYGLLQRVEDLIRQSYQQGKYLELNQCAEIVQNLQNNSHELNNVKYKNCASTLTFHQLINEKYYEGKTYFSQKKKDHIPFMLTEPTPKDQQNVFDYEKDEKPNPWRLLQEKQTRNQKIQNLSNTPRKNWIDMSEDFNEFDDFKNRCQPSPCKKKTEKSFFSSSQMLHSAAAYLHLILEREHQKKWTLQKNRIDLSSRIQKKSTKMAGIHKKVDKDMKNEALIRSTLTQQSTDCLGLQKQQRDLPEQQESQESIKQQDPNKLKIIFQDENKLRQKNKADNLQKHLKLNSCPTSKIKSQNKFIKVSIQTEPNCGQTTSRKTLRQKKVSILNNKQNSGGKLSIFNLQEKIGLVKKPRHTLPIPQNISLSHEAEKQYLELKHEQTQTLREKFTFKKRKVKERLLKKITKFVNDVEHAERNMIIQSKNCEKQLEKIKNKMQFEFESYKTQKIMSDDKALQGVRCALSKQSTGLKRYQR